MIDMCVLVENKEGCCWYVEYDGNSCAESDKNQEAPKTLHMHNICGG